MSPGQTGHITGQTGRVLGTDGTHTRGCPAKFLYVYWFFSFHIPVFIVSLGDGTSSVAYFCKCIALESGRCAATPFKSIGVWGRFGSPARGPKMWQWIRRRWICVWGAPLSIEKPAIQKMGDKQTSRIAYTVRAEIITELILKSNFQDPLTGINRLQTDSSNLSCKRSKSLKITENNN